MKLLFSFLVFAFYLNFSIAQETFNNWIYEIDIKSYSIEKNKRKISRGIFKSIGYKKSKIANPNTKYTTEQLKKKGKSGILNWVAKSKDQKHQLLSISFGGKRLWTNYYIIDLSSGKVVSKRIIIESLNYQLTPTEVSRALKDRAFDWGS